MARRRLLRFHHCKLSDRRSLGEVTSVTSTQVCLGNRGRVRARLSSRRAPAARDLPQCSLFFRSLHSLLLPGEEEKIHRGNFPALCFIRRPHASSTCFTDLRCMCNLPPPPSSFPFPLSQEPLGLTAHRGERKNEKKEEISWRNKPAIRPWLFTLAYNLT